MEQLLTGWIFDSRERGEPEFEQAKAMIVDMICVGLEPRHEPAVNESA
jgi:hypothetical protein